ncbi:hypothetical protein BGZ80_004425 [Entomortierella chlamydospora]|uniref:Uncharacterized protein n=1 Tax=Entomortierella chlamydospora TaxID=101097 RepID=A0A9P6N1F5_9FUNG|nr:hypothetical protein BGZ80_004425 [Entomortierella chlamydospora]
MGAKSKKDSRLNNLDPQHFTIAKRYKSNCDNNRNKKKKLHQQHPFSQDVTPRRRSNGRYTPVYLATDAYRPRANPIFDKLFSTFECIFTLDDSPEDLELLYQFRKPEDGTSMA